MSDDDAAKPEIEGHYGGTVEYTQTVEDAAAETVRDLGEAELERIASEASRLRDWSERYPHEAVTPGQVSIPILDFLWNEWLDDERPDRPSGEEAIRVLGSAFGHLLTLELDMRWVEVTDQYGTAVGVRAGVGDVTGYPYSSVEKRVETGGRYFFGDIHSVLAAQIAEARETGDPSAGQ